MGSGFSSKSNLYIASIEIGIGYSSISNLYITSKTMHN